MRRSFTLFLSLFVAFTIALFAQESSRDQSQAPQSYNNPVAVYGPTLVNPSGTLFESFEDPTFPPAGWVAYSPDGGTGWERLTAGTTPIPGWTGGTVTVPPGGGTGVAFCTWSTGGATSNDQWLVSSQVMSVQSGDSLTFWMRKVFDYTDSVDVLISTTDQQMSSFTITADNIAYAATDTGWSYFAYNLTDFVSAGDDIYIAFREHVADNYNDGDAVFVDLVTVGSEMPVITIAQAIEDLNNDLIPDHLGDTLTVDGVVFTPNYQTTSTSYFIHDGTAGVDMFLYGSVLVFNPGDELQVTGTVGQYNGLAEIVPLSESDIITVSTGNPLPTPILLTIGQYNSDPEAYEGSLIGFQYVSLVGGSWPSPGSYATVQISDGVDTVDLFIDSDTDIDDNPEPTWPQDVVGVGSQYCSGGCVDAGYQLMPRYYTDFMPPGTLPVELTSFTATVSANSAQLNWNTASEVNNQGFEIQRSSGSGYSTVGFVRGQGTTTQPHSYSYTDNSLVPGHYTYRLKQVDFQGSYSYSNEVSVDIYPVSYSLEQNYPNPFNPSTIINFNLKIDSKVSLKVFNVLGQQVKQLLNGAMTAGNHQVNFNASNLNSGVYFYRLEATGIDGSTFSAVKKMMLTK